MVQGYKHRQMDDVSPFYRQCISQPPTLLYLVCSGVHSELLPVLGELLQVLEVTDDEAGEVGHHGHRLLEHHLRQSALWGVCYFVLWVESICSKRLFTR